MGDHHDLAGRLLQGGGDDAGNDIRWTTRRIGHNEFHRAIRIERARRNAGAAMPAANAPATLTMARRDGAFGEATFSAARLVIRNARTLNLVTGDLEKSGRDCSSHV